MSYADSGRTAPTVRSICERTWYLLATMGVGSESGSESISESAPTSSPDSTDVGIQATRTQLATTILIMQPRRASRLPWIRPNDPGKLRCDMVNTATRYVESSALLGDWCQTCSIEPK